MDESVLLCHRCGRPLHPGVGAFYVVRIEAFADPTPPRITPEDLERDPAAEMRELVDQMHDRSEQELRDQVHRRLTLHLCRECYTRWIEDPTPSRGQAEGC